MNREIGMDIYTQLCIKQITNSNPGFPGSLVGKESTCNVGDLGLIPGLGRSPGEQSSYPL